MFVSVNKPDLISRATAGAENSTSLGAAAGEGKAVVRHVQANVRLLFDPLPALSTELPEVGDLYVAESHLIWYAPEKPVAVWIDYRSIVMHALSRQGDPVAGGPCIYCQVQDDSLQRAEDAGHEDDNDDDDEDMMPCEMRIVPADAASVDDIYQAICECAALHPDSDNDDDDDNSMGVGAEGDAAEWAFDPQAAQALEMSEIGQAALAHLESVFGVATKPDPQAQARPADANGDCEGAVAQVSADDQFADAAEDEDR
ncbi:regulator of volume decrease after cellular swelling-domain-containing protein [Entophlyctis helioformis]|nr:regulator of volume decrease after cellular swelling-domain-containing protein [Entophlyctis helioformis]